MKQLVTGAAGFIGSNYVFYMREEHPDVDLICLDSLTYAGNIKTISHFIDNNEIEFIVGDITDSNLVESLFQKHKIDTVVNFAAESHVDRSIDNASVFLETNILGTQVLLDVSKRHGIDRFHQVSTDEVYGDLPLSDKSLLFNEDSPINPSSPYSASKASADFLVMSYFKTYGLPVTISRCSNNYGPYQFPEKLIPLMTINAMNGKSLPVYGTGENVRDWLYVDDHNRAIDLIINKGRIGEIYNIGGNNEISNIEIVKQILDHVGGDDNLIKFVEDRLGHDLRYGIDATKIEKELGWTPKVAVERGLKDTIDWYINNEDWWNDIISGSYVDYYNKMYGNLQ